MEILNDFNTSVEKALDEIDPEWREYDGLIVCGTHSTPDIKFIISRIEMARETGRPFLGICHGHQLAAQEYAKNVLGQSADDILIKLPQLKVGLHDGETYWNNYEVVEGFEDLWKKADNFITCQFHPEYQSSKEKPHPLLVNFLNYAKAKMAV